MWKHFFSQKMSLLWSHDHNDHWKCLVNTPGCWFLFTFKKRDEGVVEQEREFCFIRYAPPRQKLQGVHTTGTMRGLQVLGPSSTGTTITLFRQVEACSWTSQLSCPLLLGRYCNSCKQVKIGWPKQSKTFVLMLLHKQIWTSLVKKFFKCEWKNAWRQKQFSLVRNKIYSERMKPVWVERG